MPVISPYTSKLRAQLKMAINRLRLVQQKETAIAKQQRRAMAQLLEEGREQSARIRVENIIREDVNIELLEILELYCELLLARIGLLDSPTCDPGLEEAVKTVIYAGPRTEIKELHQIRELLIHRFGKDFAKEVAENPQASVPPKVIKRLSTDPPSEELVTLYLSEIARAYNAPFSGLPKNEEKDTNGVDEDDDDDNEGPRSGLVPAEPLLAEKPTSTRRLSGVADLPDPDAPPKSPISVMTPSPTLDNLRPSLKLSTESIPKVAHARPAKPKGDADLDALRDRFEALRQRR